MEAATTPVQRARLRTAHAQEARRSAVVHRVAAERLARSAGDARDFAERAREWLDEVREDRVEGDRPG